MATYANDPRGYWGEDASDRGYTGPVAPSPRAEDSAVSPDAGPSGAVSTAELNTALGALTFVTPAQLTTALAAERQKNWLQEATQPSDGFTVPRMLLPTVSTPMTSGTYYVNALRTTDTGTATGVRVVCSTTFTTVTDLRIALYSSDLATKHGETANLGNLTSGVQQVPFAGGAVTYAADAWYYAVLVAYQHSAGAFRAMSLSSTALVPTVNGRVVSGSATGYTGGALPSPFVASLSASAAVFLVEFYT